MAWIDNKNNINNLLTTEMTTNKLEKYLINKVSEIAFISASGTVVYNTAWTQRWITDLYLVYYFNSLRHLIIYYCEYILQGQCVRVLSRFIFICNKEVAQE